MNCARQKTAIIMVTYNGWTLTEACLKDLEHLNCGETAGQYIVAIADNCSTDCTVEKLRCQFPWVHVYPQKENLGFGAANNAAIRGLIAEGIEFDAICLLNNDTRFNADAIVKLRQDLDRTAKGLTQDSSNNAAVISPTTMNADGSRQNNFFAGLGPEGIGYLQFFLNAFRNEAAAARILEGTPQPVTLAQQESAQTATQSAAKFHLNENNKPLLETYWTSAVCWMLKRQLWEAAGGFDENIFMYYEDADLSLRLRKLGARFFISQESIITHLGGGSASNSLSRALQHDRSQQYVFRKHFGIQGLLLSKTFRFSRSLIRIATAIPQCIAGANAKQKREYVRHHFALLKESL